MVQNPSREAVYQEVNKFSVFHGIRKFITVFTQALCTDNKAINDWIVTLNKSGLFVSSFLTRQWVTDYRLLL